LRKGGKDMEEEEEEEEEAKSKAVFNILLLRQYNYCPEWEQIPLHATDTLHLTILTATDLHQYKSMM
jgi:hypothetical protein